MVVQATEADEVLNSAVEESAVPAAEVEPADEVAAPEEAEATELLPAEDAPALATFAPQHNTTLVTVTLGDMASVQAQGATAVRVRAAVIYNGEEKRSVQQEVRRYPAAYRACIARRAALHEPSRRLVGDPGVRRGEHKGRGKEYRREHQSTVTPIIFMMRSRSSLLKKSISTTPFVCRPFGCIMPGVTLTAQPRCRFIFSARFRT